MMPRYLVRNRITNEQDVVEAPYAQDACESLGWRIGDCYVKLLRDTEEDDTIAVTGGNRGH